MNPAELTLLYIDPLSSLDPAALELAQTRYTAERAIYFMQRAVSVLRLNTELLILDLTENPGFSVLFEDISAFRTTAADFVRAVDELPAKMAREQKEFVAEIAAQKEDLSELARDFQTTFAAGSEMADSVSRGVQTLDAFIVGVKDETESHPGTTAAGTTLPAGAPTPAITPAGESRPFDVLDYAVTADRISDVSRTLDGTIRSLEKLIASPGWQDRQQAVNRLVAEMEAGAERVTGRLFVRGIILVGVLLTGGLVVMLIYRGIGRRFHGARRTDLLASYDEMKVASETTKEAYQPLMATLNDIKEYLGLDLSATSVAGIGDQVQKARDDAGKVQESIDSLLETLDELASQLATGMPAPDKAPAPSEESNAGT